MVSEFLAFVQKAPSAFHAAEEISSILRRNGFIALNERDDWQLLPGGRYYVTRNRSSIIAFALPKEGLSHFQIVASHSDSPVFKLKPLAEDAGKYLRLNTERYGGMIMSSWFDRPLSIAGRLLVREDGKLVTKLVDLARDAALIPNMPIHFNRDVNDGYKYNAQVDTLPLYAQNCEKGRLMNDVAQAAGVDPEAVAASDLYLYSRTPGSVWGADDAFFSCPRIDDLECAWTSLMGFLKAEPKGHANVCAVFDNEEVGSRSKQGADSSFFGDVLHRIASSLGLSDAQARAAMGHSFMVSADNAHAVHPNHPEKYDAQNRTYMNEGVVIKHSANQSYTTDAVSAAVFGDICASAGVPVQQFANRSDTPGGSTLGNVANTHVSMNTVDIGLAQLAMHSACETAGTRDIIYMIDALTAFYAADIRVLEDGVIELA